MNEELEGIDFEKVLMSLYALVSKQSSNDIDMKTLQESVDSWGKLLKNSLNTPDANVFIIKLAECLSKKRSEDKKFIIYMMARDFVNSYLPNKATLHLLLRQIQTTKDLSTSQKNMLIMALKPTEKG